MSKYSGKFDLYDEMSIGSNSDNWDEMYEKFKETKLYKYQGDDKVEIKHYSIYDLIEYFTYIPIISSNHIIILGSEPFILEESNSTIKFILDSANKEYRRSKRKNYDFDVKNVFLSEKSYSKQVIDIVMNKKGKATFDDVKHIHTDMYYYYSKKLSEDEDKYIHEKECEIM